MVEMYCFPLPRKPFGEFSCFSTRSKKNNTVNLVQIRSKTFILPEKFLEKDWTDKMRSLKIGDEPKLRAKQFVIWVGVKSEYYKLVVHS